VKIIRIKMNVDQRRGAEAALAETIRWQEKQQAVKCFDSHQEAERDKHLAFCERHIAKLLGWLADNEFEVTVDSACGIYDCDIQSGRASIVT
jgi:hypothetical protein